MEPNITGPALPIGTFMDAGDCLALTLIQRVTQGTKGGVGIKSATTANGLLLWLRLTREGQPKVYIDNIGASTPVLSFGRDWVLEVTPDACWQGLGENFPGAVDASLRGRYVIERGASGIGYLNEHDGDASIFDLRMGTFRKLSRGPVVYADKWHIGLRLSDLQTQWIVASSA